MSTDHDIEPVLGLPSALPPGETIVWQGQPEWKAFARDTFKMRWLAAYFAVFIGARLVMALREGHGYFSVLLVVLLAGACLSILSFLAWLNARAAMYTLTTRRLVLRIGVALPMTWNLPFRRLASADLKVHSAGDGDIVLDLTAPDRIAWLQLWPHAQPGRYLKARPMLRALRNPERVAGLLAETMRAWAERESASVVISSGDAIARVPARRPDAGMDIVVTRVVAKTAIKMDLAPEIGS